MPLFPDKDKIEVKNASREKGARNEYMINMNCRYFRPEKYPKPALVDHDRTDLGQVRRHQRRFSDLR